MSRIIIITLLLLIILATCTGCTFIVAKETAKVIDMVFEEEPNPTKKETILIKQNKIRDKAKDFYCSKVKDEVKCQ